MSDRNDDEVLAKGTDQTNGLVPGLDGDSDGTAASDVDDDQEREVTSYGLVGDALGDHDQDDEEVRADDDR